ncbi:unnamed protein product [Phaeothamnion confervicola]
MDPRSEWALEDFQSASFCLRFLDEGEGVSALPGRRRLAHQGETLRAMIEVQLPATIERQRELVQRWVQFGKELNVEVEVMVEDEADADASEEPSLTRDFEGRETDHDHAVLMRRNCLVRLAREGAIDGSADGTSDAPRSPLSVRVAGQRSASPTPALELAYLLEVELQVPVDFLGKPLALRTTMSPSNLRENDVGEHTPALLVAAAVAASSSPSPSSPAGRGLGGGGGGIKGTGLGSQASAFTARLHRLFELSRVAPVRLPAKHVRSPLLVLQPIVVRSRPAWSAPGGRACVAVDVENTHRSLVLVVHDLDVHLGATVRGRGNGGGGGGSSFSGSDANGGGGDLNGDGGGGGGGGSDDGGHSGHGGSGWIRSNGARYDGARGDGGGASAGTVFVRRRRTDLGAAAPLGGLADAIRAPPGDAVDLRGHFHALWTGVEALPVAVAPGGRHSFVLVLAPDPSAPVPAKAAVGAMETPVTIAWSLSPPRSAAAAVAPTTAATGRSVADSTTAAVARNSDDADGGIEAAAAIVYSCTSVHMVQWRREARVKTELLLRLEAPPQARLGEPFRLELAVRNLSPAAVELTARFGGLASPLSVGTSARGGGSGGISGSGIGCGDDAVALDGGAATSSRVAAASAFRSPPCRRKGSDLASNRPSSSAVAVARTIAGSAFGRSEALDALLAGAALLPLDSAVPLGRLEPNGDARVSAQLLPLRAGLARARGVSLYDALSGVTFWPAASCHVLIESGEG